MTMTTEKLAELKHVAQNAWPGPWAMNPEPFDNDGTPETVVSAMDGKAAICVTMDWGKNNPLMREANALHIAACDPQTILSLIALAEHALNANPVASGSLNAECALQPEEGRTDIFYAVLNPDGTEGVLFKDIADANFTATGDCDSWSTPTIGEAFRESYSEEGVLSVREVVLQSPASQLALPAGPVPATTGDVTKCQRYYPDKYTGEMVPHPDGMYILLSDAQDCESPSPAVAQPVADERVRAALMTAREAMARENAIIPSVHFTKAINDIDAALCQPAEEGGKS